jgi:hypothetical protein
MFDQFFRFLFTLTLSGLFYMTLVIAGVESWHLISGDEMDAWGRLVTNALSLMVVAGLAYSLHSRWVFRRRAELKKCGVYILFMAVIWVLHEVFLAVMLAVLAWSYPVVLAMTLCFSLSLAYVGCKKYIF